MVVAFNILKIWFDEFSIIMFWVIPAFLGTFQLFFFGTYLPHKYPHTKNRQPYKARTQKKNHFLAMISCYFLDTITNITIHPKHPGGNYTN
jgi:beta-carotene ketolase (CrtW type)